ncbi:MAG: hypothetical protein AAFW60_00700 [Pseudomonadota bacterium]
MVRRVCKKIINFQFPFAIDEIHKVFPPGEYTIETEEESIPGSSIIHFRHVETVLIVHPPNGKPGSTHFWAVDPDALDKAIANDADQCLEVKRRSGAIDAPRKTKSKSE